MNHVSVNSVTMGASQFDGSSVRIHAPDPLIGHTIAERYRIIDPLGAGGMGIVYKVEHVRIGKLMAMKLLAGELSRDVTIVRRFKREALLASKLSHPNTVQVFDYGQADRFTYLVMELVMGNDLARMARNDGPMSMGRVANILVQVCNSLAEAHQQGIIHRDLKPENILVVRSNQQPFEAIKVCDFGLAKLLEAPELNDVTSQGTVLGTPHYMAPEQIRGEEVDHRSDIYSLGALMYRLLTGEPPFTGNSPIAVLTQHLSESPIPPSKRCEHLEIPQMADRIILKALSKDPVERFQSVKELKDVLQDFMGELDAQTSSMRGRSGGPDSYLFGINSGVPAQSDGAPPPFSKAATRDEVDAYERKLKRLRLVSFVVPAAIALAVVGLGTRTLRANWGTKAFLGVEQEPNNEAGQATKVPFGKEVQGWLGKRISPTESDRDFYEISVPEQSKLIRIRTSAIPNFASCTWLYRAGYLDPLGKFCTGMAGRDLDTGPMQVLPGRYLIAVLQDLSRYEPSSQVWVHENISDKYHLNIQQEVVNPRWEQEPNDNPKSANTLAIGEQIQGALSFVHDVDVFCVPPSEKSWRWVIADSEIGKRDPGVVLQATIGIKSNHEHIVRIHQTSKENRRGKRTVDELNPYRHVWKNSTTEQQKECVEVKLVADPWSTSSSTFQPGSIDVYSIKAEEIGE
jgi:eukaryotic-like serine/threonine-protein kinase